MTRLNHISTQPLADGFETTVAAYESARLAGKNIDIVSMLHGGDSRQRAELACELIRIDLEVANDQGVDRQLEDYRSALPEVFGYPDLVAQIAFEHWRLRHDRGEAVDPNDYLSQLGLSHSDWPASLAGSEGWQCPADFPEVGELFDGMSLEEMIGSGTFSRVYVARQPWCANRKVVLKVTTNKSVEPDRLGKLQHTNVVPVYSLHHDWGLLGVCMPLLGRETLGARLRPVDSQRARASTQNIGPGVSTVDDFESPMSEGTSNQSARPAGGIQAASPLPWRIVCDLGMQLARGLQHAHVAGIVHGDIKPANILLGDDGIPRLLDFNLSRDTNDATAGAFPIGGTVPFMSPQQLAGILAKQPAESLDDIYSLGAVLYVMLTGKQPFETPPGPLRKVVPGMIDSRNVGVAPLRKLAPNVPASVAAIVEKCLAADPRSRYQSAGDLADELQRELRDEPLQLTREPSTWERLCKAMRRNRGLLVRGLATLALVVAAGALFSAWRASEQSNRLAQQARANEFQELFAEASRLLGVPSADDDLRQQGVATAAKAIELVGLDQDASIDFKDLVASDDQSSIFSAVDLLLAYADAESLRIDERELQQYRQVSATQEPDSAATRSTAAVKVAERQTAFELLSEGRFADARRLLEQLVEQFPRDATLWLELGSACAATRQYEQSLAAFTAAQAIAPECPVVWRHRAYLQIDQLRFDEALHDLDIAEQITPSSPAVAMNRAVALLGRGQADAAEAAASDAILRGMNQPRAYLVRARCRHLLGNDTGAYADQQAALMRDPIDADDWAARAVLLAGTDSDRAMQQIEQGLAQYPNSVVLLRNKLHILADVRGDNQQALGVSKQLCELLPESVSERLGLAVCHTRLGQYETAKQMAGEVEPMIAQPLDRLQLACVYSLLSKQDASYLDKSLASLQKALAAQPLLAGRASRDPDLKPLLAKPKAQQFLAAAKQLLPDTTPEATRVE